MIVGEELLGKLAHVLVEGGREEEIAAISVLVSVTARQDLAHFFLPIIMKHLVSLVNDEESAAVHGQKVGSGHEVDETTRSSDEDVTTFLEFVHLLAHRTATICNAWAKHGAIAESTTLIEDLAAQLSSRCDDQDERLSSYTLRLIEAFSKVGTRSSELLGLTHQLGESRNQVGCRLAGT